MIKWYWRYPYRSIRLVWNASNWSNTGDLGDLQLKDGPFFFNVGNIVDYSNEIVLYPNPASGNVYLRWSAIYSKET